MDRRFAWCAAFGTRCMRPIRGLSALEYRTDNNTILSVSGSVAAVIASVFLSAWTASSHSSILYYSKLHDVICCIRRLSERLDYEVVRYRRAACSSPMIHRAIGSFDVKEGQRGPRDSTLSF